MFTFNRFFLFCMLFTMIFFSCSNSQENNFLSEQDEVNTLKNYIVSETEKIGWTEEINPNVVKDKRKDDINRFGSPKYSTIIGAAMLPVTEDEAVYPYIKNLGSLNMENIDDNQLKYVQDFCSLIISSEKDEKELFSFMSSDKEYMLTIFLYDMADVIFDSYVAAAPVFEETTARYPVRFNTNDGYLDLQLYIVPFNSQWRIDQIRYGEIVYE